MGGAEEAITEICLFAWKLYFALFVVLIVAIFVSTFAKWERGRDGVGGIRSSIGVGLYVIGFAMIRILTKDVVTGTDLRDLFIYWFYFGVIPCVLVGHFFASWVKRRAIRSGRPPPSEITFDDLPQWRQEVHLLGRRIERFHIWLGNVVGYGLPVLVGVTLIMGLVSILLFPTPPD